MLYTAAMKSPAFLTPLFVKTFLWTFSIFIGASLLLWFFSGALGSDIYRGVWTWLILGAILAPWIIKTIRTPVIRPSNEALQAYAEQQGYQFYTSQQTEGLGLVFGAVGTISYATNPYPLNAVVGDGWLYSDFTFDVYDQSSDGTSRKIRTEYYGIMSAKLSRQLPQIFFDSYTSHGRQFKFQFASAQEYDFEGDFNQHFKAYIPAEYTIDTLSFISPEVMVALQAAADYDIEITGNHVILFSEAGVPERLLPDMAAKLQAIVRELEDNMRTYHDSHTAGVKGYKTVARKGSRLEHFNFSRETREQFLAVVAAVILLRILALIIDGH